MGTIQLKKYKYFLDLFDEYSRLDTNDEDITINTYTKLVPCYNKGEFITNIACEFKEEVDGYIQKIQVFLENIENVILEAKEEYLSNLYSIASIEDKKHFLNITIDKFIELYPSDLFNMHYPEDMFSKQGCCHEELNKKGVEAWNEWAIFIHSILSNYNIALFPPLHVELHPNCPPANILDLLYNITEDEETQSNHLRSFFVKPEKYDKLMSLVQMTTYLKGYGDSFKSIPKYEIASFLHSLFSKGYLQAKNKNQLKNIAENVFRIGSTMDRTEKRNLKLFSFIPDEKYL
ncbi:MAG: hypothetical protein LBU84_15630 [Prevotella sp.]|jgi:hypothetical protein|nr:hypothetical protein [Prevotella sp.]